MEEGESDGYNGDRGGGQPFLVQDVSMLTQASGPGMSWGGRLHPPGTASGWWERNIF